MSTLKVNKLRDTAGSADANTLDPNGGAVLAGVTTISTARVSTGITSTSLQVGAAVTISESGIEASGIGITCANINGTQIGGRRNLIINGAMNVAQRATSSTSGGGYNTIDRIDYRVYGADETPTQAQVDVASGTSPYTEGFRKSFKFTNGNQSSGAAVDDYLFIFYQVEGQDIVQSGWNYTDPNSFITMSFWVKSSVAQNFYGYLRSRETTEQSIAFDTVRLSANTWTKVVRTFPGNSNIVMANDNGQGLGIYFSQFFGTDRTNSSKSTTAWAAYDNDARTPDQTSTWWTTDDATWEITGLQLEVGSQATAFEHRSFAEELSLCRRYYQQYTNIVGTGYASDSANTSYHHGFTFPVEMRSAPTYSITNTGSTAGQYVTDGNNNVSISSLSGGDFQTHNMAVHYNLSGDLTNFSAAHLFGVDSTTYQTTHKLSSEL